MLDLLRILVLLVGAATSVLAIAVVVRFILAPPSPPAGYDERPGEEGEDDGE